MTALGLEVRAGLHTGEVELVGDDVAGLAVHIAARVMGEAPRGPRARLEHGARPRRRLRACASRTAAGASCAACPGEWGLWEVDGLNFARDVVERGAAGQARDRRAGARRRPPRVALRRGRRAGRRCCTRTSPRTGVRRGDVVLTLLGNRPEWVLAMVACFRAGYAVLPVHRAAAPEGPAAAPRRDRPGARRRRRAQPRRARGRGLGRPDAVGAVGRAAGARRAAARRARRRATRAWSRSPPAPRASRRRSCTARATCPASGCRPSTGWPRSEGDLVWCTAASGWSKSARNAFIAPWLRGAAALLHDARFDPAERLEIAEREGVNVLCMAPTEYRVIANRSQPRPDRLAARAGRRGRGARPRRARRLARGDRPLDPRRLRPDGDRPAHRAPAGRGAAARLDGPPAARRRR